MLAWIVQLGYKAGAGATPPTPDPTPTVTPAGRSKRRYVIAIDGQDFIVSSQSDAIELLQRARAIAEQQAERKAVSVERRLKKRADVPVVELKTPEISVPFELREATAPLIADIERLYERASMEMELRLLLAKQQLLDEDDEDVLLLS